MKILTESEQRKEAIKLLSNRKKNDKFSLWYIIRVLNHKKYFYSYIEWYNREEWLNRLIQEIETKEGLEKLLNLGSFQHLQNK